MVEFILLALLFFVVALPVFFVRAFIRRRGVKSAVEGAADFAPKAAIAMFVGLPFCVIVLGVPFGILNMIGIAVFGQQFYWPLIVPGLIAVYAIGASIIFWSIRSERRRVSAQRHKHERRVP